MERTVFLVQPPTDGSVHEPIEGAPKVLGAAPESCSPTMSTRAEARQVSTCRGASPWRCHRCMASQTSTIRVSRATRDLLAEQARERGLSLAALLAEIADQRRREAVWRSEREASRIDEESSAATTELREWEATLEDGLG